MPLNQARYKAYRSVLRQAGLPADARWVVRSSMSLAPAEMIEQSVASLFESGRTPPDALVVQHDGLALVLLDVMRHRGIRVPKDVAVIGMGDYPISRFEGVSLSTVKEPIEEIGSQSAQLALDLLAKPSKTPVQRLLPCGELRIRKTTCAAG
jgi:DNA-binding LacI/PurR family transcriptional regulator